MTRWVVQPIFDEGDSWEDSTGTPHVIEAATREEAAAAFPVHEYISLADVHTMSPSEWFKSGGYALEGIDVR